MKGLRKSAVAVVAALSLVAAGGPGAGAETASTERANDVSVVAAHSCSRGYRHGIIGGRHRCLRRGQFCARRYDRQYHRYGFHCHRRDSRGNYHLS